MLSDFKLKGQALLEEWYFYKSTRPRDHVFDIQADKDELQKWATHLQTALLWETNGNKIVKICHQFEYKLKQFKEKVVIELLKNGSA